MSTTPTSEPNLRSSPEVKMDIVDGYVVGYCPTLSRSSIEYIIKEIFNFKQNKLFVAGINKNEPRILEGRASIQLVYHNDSGSIVIKSYHRGGLLGRLVRSRYVKRGPYRSESEFQMLLFVRSLGIMAPEPVLWAAYHSATDSVGQILPCYRAWLATREIPYHQTLAEMAKNEPERARILFEPLLHQIDLLIANGVFHLDLHPGNVVIDKSNTVYLLDFDKAQVVKWGTLMLRDRYLRRWRRAVIKHKLPEFLSSLMCLGLRRHTVV